MTIVTGADSSHYRSLLQFINSLQLIEKGKFNLIVYDLGCTIAEIKLIKHLHPGLSLKKFDFEKFPGHYNLKINSGSYAWKPAIINHEYNLLIKGNFILWLDAGCFIRKPLFLIRSAIYFYGFHSPLSGARINELTHANSLEKMDLVKEGDKKMLAAYLVGLKVGKKENNILIQRWARAAEDNDIIAPKGSDKSNHRYDQSLLSLLYYNIYNINKGPLLAHKSLEIVPHKDIG